MSSFYNNLEADKRKTHNPPPCNLMNLQIPTPPPLPKNSNHVYKSSLKNAQNQADLELARLQNNDFMPNFQIMPVLQQQTSQTQSNLSDQMVTSPQNSQPDSPTILNQSYPIGPTKVRLEQKIINRVEKEELIDRNVLPPENVPPAYFPVVKKLELQQTKDKLAGQLRARPSEKQLLDKGIIHDQKARKEVASKLETKLRQRPGPLDVMKRGYFEPVNKPKKFTFHSYCVNQETGKLEKILNKGDSKHNTSSKEQSNLIQNLNQSSIMNQSLRDELSSSTNSTTVQEPTKTTTTIIPTPSPSLQGPKKSSHKKQKVTKDQSKAHLTQLRKENERRHQELLKQSEEFQSFYADKIADRYEIKGDSHEFSGDASNPGYGSGSGMNFMGNNGQGHGPGQNSSMAGLDGIYKSQIPSPPGPPPQHAFHRDGPISGSKARKYYDANDPQREIREFSKEYLCKEKYEYLKRQCKYRNLKVGGTKEELINRLIAFAHTPNDQNESIALAEENEKLKQELEQQRAELARLRQMHNTTYIQSAANTRMHQESTSTATSTGNNSFSIPGISTPNQTEMTKMSFTQREGHSTDETVSLHNYQMLPATPTPYQQSQPPQINLPDPRIHHPSVPLNQHHEQVRFSSTPNLNEVPNTPIPVQFTNVNQNQGPLQGIIPFNSQSGTQTAPNRSKHPSSQSSNMTSPYNPMLNQMTSLHSTPQNSPSSSSNYINRGNPNQASYMVQYDHSNNASRQGHHPMRLLPDSDVSNVTNIDSGINPGRHINHVISDRQNSESTSNLSILTNNSNANSPYTTHNLEGENNPNNMQHIHFQSVAVKARKYEQEIIIKNNITKRRNKPRYNRDPLAKGPKRRGPRPRDQVMYRRNMQGYTDDSTSSVSQFNGQGGPNMGKHSGPYSHSNRSYGSHHGINHPNQYPDSPNMKRRSMNSSCSMNAPGGPLGSHSGPGQTQINFPPERHGSSLVLTQKSSTEGQSHSHSNHSVSHTLGPPNNAMQAGPASVHSGMDCNYSNISSPNSNFEHYNASCGPGSHSQQQSNCNSTRESDHDYGYRSDNYAKRERRDPGPSSRKLREGVNVNIDQNGERLTFYELVQMYDKRYP